MPSTTTPAPRRRVPAALLVDVGAGPGVRAVDRVARGVPGRGPAAGAVPGPGRRDRVRGGVHRVVRVFGRAHRERPTGGVLRHRRAAVGVRCRFAARGGPAAPAPECGGARRARMGRTGGAARARHGPGRARRLPRVPRAVADRVRGGDRGVGRGRDARRSRRSAGIPSPALPRPRRIRALPRALAGAGDLPRRQRPHRGGGGGRSRHRHAVPGPRACADVGRRRPGARLASGSLVTARAPGRAHRGGRRRRAPGRCLADGDVGSGAGDRGTRAGAQPRRGRAA